MLSGLMVSQAVTVAIGVTIVPSSLWITLHSISADATIALLLVHFALHWRWIVNAARTLGRPRRSSRVAADLVAEIRLATRRLETPPRGGQYATVPVTTDDRYRP
ncbi:MAG: hypothetical protein NTX16_12200 [Actinobacteria bacterium]|nr:hypothetical protein [Actinomycetota bacterium]